MRASRGLKWENKMYKLKRSIAVRLRDLKSRLEILLSLCSPVDGIILTAPLMVVMI